MAEYTKEAAIIEEVYIRVRKANGDDEYLRRPYNFVTYDDGQQYLEPVSIGFTPFTYSDVNNNATASKFLILDTDPFPGLTDIR